MKAPTSLLKRRKAFLHTQLHCKQPCVLKWLTRARAQRPDFTGIVEWYDSHEFLIRTKNNFLKTLCRTKGRINFLVRFSNQVFWHYDIFVYLYLSTLVP